MSASREGYVEIVTLLITVGVDVNKWKNHFIEMKGDVGMSVHEKGGEQECYTNTQDHL